MDAQPRPRPNPGLQLILSFLPKIEPVFTVAAVVGIGLAVIGYGTTVALISLSGLGAIYFLNAYRPLDLPEGASSKSHFMQLLAGSVLPKFMWISCAVSSITVLFYVIDTEGFKSTAKITMSCMANGCIIMLFLLVIGVKETRHSVSVLYRALPLLVADVYIYIKSLEVI